MKTIRVIFLLLFSLGFAGVASAQTFTWVDQSGTTRTTNYRPLPHQVKNGHEVIASTPPAQARTAPQVELYITSWCPYCHKAKAFFESKGIAYRAYDIERDKNAAARKARLDAKRGVPFAVVNGIPIHGYAPQKYLQALNR